MKPRGLWYEVDGGWRDWLNSEMPSWWESYKWKYHVDHGSARILRLTTPKDIDKFTKEWCRPRPWHTKDMERVKYGVPDWSEVSKQYDGLEIAPYQWSRRMDYIWYYGWDCSSGVIWRPAPDTKIRLLGPAKLGRKEREAIG